MVEAWNFFFDLYLWPKNLRNWSPPFSHCLLHCLEVLGDINLRKDLGRGPSFVSSIRNHQENIKADEFQTFFGGKRMCCEMVNLYLDPFEIEETSQYEESHVRVGTHSRLCCLKICIHLCDHKTQKSQLFGTTVTCQQVTKWRVARCCK